MTTRYLTTLELQREQMSFASGHTIFFSPTHREPLHGHAYTVYFALTAWVEENGMTVDNRYYMQRIEDLCRKLDQTFLMPQLSPYLTFREDEDYYYFTFNHKDIPFLKEDVTLLPVANITVEELSRWFIEELRKDEALLLQHQVEKMLIKVFSAPGQSGSHEWSKQDTILS